MKSGIWNRNYKLLFASRVGKVIAENFASIAFVWLLLESGGDAVSTSIMFTVSIVPQMVIGIFVSPWLSKGNLPKWMFASDVVRAFIIFLIPLLYVLGTLPLWMFFVAAFVQSACGSVYNPAALALLPKIVDKSHIQKANALMVSSDKTLYLFGMACAGALVTLISSSFTLFLSSILFLISAILVLMIKEKTEDAIAQVHKQSTPPASYWKQIRDGFEIVFKHKYIAPIAFVAIFINFGITAWSTLRSVYVYQDLHGDASILSMVQGASFVGGLLVGIILSKVTIRRHGALFILATLLLGTALILSGLNPVIFYIVLAGLIIGMSETAINVPISVIIQTTIPSHQQAQVLSALSGVASILLPVSGIIVGPLAVLFGNGLVMAGGGMIVMLAGIGAIIFTSVLRMETFKTESPEKDSLQEATIS